jgi:hypothetical protein
MIRHTTFKIYCDQTNSNIITHFVPRVFVKTSSFELLETYYTWAPLGDAVQSSIKMVYFTDVDKVKCVLQFEKNIWPHWFSSSFV